MIFRGEGTQVYRRGMREMFKNSTMSKAVRFVVTSAPIPQFAFKYQNTQDAALRNGSKIAKKRRAGIGLGGWFRWVDREELVLRHPRTHKSLRAMRDQKEYLMSLSDDDDTTDWWLARWQEQRAQCRLETILMPTFKWCALHTKHLMYTEVCCVCMERSREGTWIDIECTMCLRWSHRACTDGQKADLQCLSGDLAMCIVESEERFLCKLCRGVHYT